MRIFTKCVYGWQPDGSLKLEEAESFDYEGPVALCKDSPSPPPAPDYTAAANAQGTANLQAGIQQSLLSNPNWNTPLGTQTVSTPDWMLANGGGERPTINISLSPEQQHLFDTQNQISQSLADTGLAGLGRVSESMGQDFQAPGQIQTSLGQQGNIQQQLGTSPFQGMGDNGSPIQYNVDMSNVPGIQTALGTSPFSGMGTNGSPINYGFDQTGGPQRSIDFSGAPQLPGVNDFSANRDQVTQGLMSRIQPQMQIQRQQLDTQLRNQGLVPGTEAYDNAMRVQSQRENDMNTQAMLAGSQEQSRLFGLGLQARQQAVGETTGQGQFANQAESQAYQEALNRAGFGNQAQQQWMNQAIARGQFGNEAQQQAALQALAQGQFSNQAQQQWLNQALARGQFGNQAQNQAFQQALAGGQFGNTAQQQALQQALLERQLPLTELNSLRTGAMPQMPQFQGYGGTGVQPAPLFNAAQQQYGAGLNAYNAEIGQNNNLMSGLFGLGASALMAPVGTFSDRRLKSNVERIGTHASGLPVYSYEIFGRREIGVMADEAMKVKPDAVSRHASGFLMVDYGRL